jgi:hypothetical protein
MTCGILGIKAAAALRRSNNARVCSQTERWVSLPKLPSRSPGNKGGADKGVVVVVAVAATGDDTGDAWTGAGSSKRPTNEASVGAKSYLLAPPPSNWAIPAPLRCGVGKIMNITEE